MTVDSTYLCIYHILHMNTYVGSFVTLHQNYGSMARKPQSKRQLRNYCTYFQKISLPVQSKRPAWA
jgi:hypothetical protein